MTYAALCELVAYRGWCLSLTSANGGPNITTRDQPAELMSVVIHESRGARLRRESAILRVRLNGKSLDEAAEIATRSLVTAGVIQG